MNNNENSSKYNRVFMVVTLTLHSKYIHVISSHTKSTGLLSLSLIHFENYIHFRHVILCYVERRWLLVKWWNDPHTKHFQLKGCVTHTYNNVQHPFISNNYYVVQCRYVLAIYLHMENVNKIKKIKIILPFVSVEQNQPTQL